MDLVPKELDLVALPSDLRFIPLIGILFTVSDLCDYGRHLLERIMSRTLLICVAVELNILGFLLSDV